MKASAIEEAAKSALRILESLVNDDPKTRQTKPKKKTNPKKTKKREWETMDQISTTKLRSIVPR